MEKQLNLSNLSSFDYLQKIKNASFNSSQSPLSIFVKQFQESNNVSAILGGKFYEMFSKNSFRGASTAATLLMNNNLLRTNIPISNFTAAINAVSYNKPIAIQLAGLATNQFQLSNNLKLLQDRFGNISSIRNKFFGSVILNTTSQYIGKIIYNQDWENLETVREVNDILISKTDEILSQPENITHSDLNEFKESVISDLKTLTSDTSEQGKTIEYIDRIMVILSLVISLYSLYSQENDLTNKELLNEVREANISLKSSIVSEMARELEVFNQTKVAQQNTIIRSAPRKNGPITAILKEGQQVTVLNGFHKYLWIVYIDSETSVPITGYVLKKHIE